MGSEGSDKTKEMYSLAKACRQNAWCAIKVKSKFIFLIAAPSCTLGGISSGSYLFAKVPVCRYPEWTRLMYIHENSLSQTDPMYEPNTCNNFSDVLIRNRTKNHQNIIELEMQLG